MSDSERRGEKREKQNSDGEESSSSDDDFMGPSLRDAAPVKKKKVLEYEKVRQSFLYTSYNYSSKM